MIFEFDQDYSQHLLRPAPFMTPGSTGFLKIATNVPLGGRGTCADVAFRNKPCRTD